MLVTVFCVVFAYIGIRLRAARLQSRAVAAIQAMDGTVLYDYQYDRANNKFEHFREVPIPTFFRELLGDHFFCRPIYVNGSGNFTDDSLQFVGQLTSLESLSLGGSPISDNGLVYLQELVNLKSLGLNGTNITNAGLKHLVNQRNLESLATYSTGVTDEGILELKKSLPSIYVDNEEWLSNMFRRGKEKTAVAPKKLIGKEGQDHSG